MLSYYGVSYGTQLGTTYAAMFPDRVRAMVLDSVLDPVQLTTGHHRARQLHPRQHACRDRPASAQCGPGEDKTS